jgi:hypothetical protein
MSAQIFEVSSSDACTVVEVLYRVHQRLLEQAQALLVTLERPDSCWGSGAEVQGYLAWLGPGQLEAHEREAICAQLRTDIRTQQAMTEQLEQLCAAMQGAR